METVQGANEEIERVVGWFAPNQSDKKTWKRDSLHASLRDLFRGKESPADIRHMAWGTLVWEIHRSPLNRRKDGGTSPDEGSPEEAERHRATLRGLKPNCEPLKLGYQSLKFAVEDGKLKKGSIIKALEYIAKTDNLKLPALFLAALGEPEWFFGWLMAQWQKSHSADDREVKLSLDEAARCVAKSLLETESPQDNDNVHRALKFFIFVCAKTLYDSVKDIQKNPDSSLFCRILQDLPDQTANLHPIEVVVPYLDLRDEKEPLWEQYSHIWLCGDAVSPLERVEDKQKQDRHEATPEPDDRPVSIGRQFENLERHLNSWLTTGVMSAEDIRDEVQVRYAECVLPDVANRWHDATLGEVATRFAAQVAKRDLSSHLVCLVGPYGTGKTTAAQRLFIELCRNQSEPWQALQYDAATATLRLVPLWGRDAAFRFKQCDLSRVLLELGNESALKLSMEGVMPGARIVLNASEMNAVNLVGEGPGANKGLQAVETLLREVVEKYIPEDIVVFVAAQAAYVSTELRRFFAERPDFAVARARLDRLWLLRCDCSQMEIRPPEDPDADEEDPLVALLDSRFPGMPTLCTLVARRLYMPLERKRELLQREVSALGARTDRTTSVPDAVKYFCQILPTSSHGRSGGSDSLIDEWVPPKGERGMQQAFRFGIGTLATVQIALRNGFQRQFWDMVRNEFSLLRAQLSVVRGGTGKGQNKPDARLIENLCRMQWLETLDAVGDAELGTVSKQDCLQGSVGVKASLPKITKEARKKDGGAFEARNFEGKDVTVAITLGSVSSDDKNRFDTAWDVLLVSRDTGDKEPTRWLVAVDIARKEPQKRLEHLRSKAFGEKKGPLYELRRPKPGEPFVVVKCDFEPAKRIPLRLPVSDLPLVVAALTLRLGTDENGNPVWKEHADSGKVRTIRVAFDAWVNDDDSPDPATWYVDRLLFAVSEKDSVRLEQNDGTFLASLNSVMEYFYGKKWCSPDEEEKGLLVPPKEVQRALWWFEQKYLDDKWEPTDLFDSEEETTSPDPDFYELRPVKDGRIYKSRNLGILRSYRNKEDQRKLAVAFARYLEQGEKGLFFPSKPLYVNLSTGVLMKKKAQGGEIPIGSKIVPTPQGIPQEKVILAVLPERSSGDGHEHPDVLWFRLNPKTGTAESPRGHGCDSEDLAEQTPQPEVAEPEITAESDSP